MRRQGRGALLGIPFVLIVAAMPIFLGCGGEEKMPPTPAEMLFAASRAGRLDEVKEILESKPLLVSSRDEKSKTALHHAASAGHVEVVKLLLENGADPSARDSFNITPLEKAVLKHHEDVVALLMSTPTPEDSQGEKGLIGRSKSRHLEMQELLEEAGGGKL